MRNARSSRYFTAVLALGPGLAAACEARLQVPYRGYHPAGPSHRRRQYSPQGVTESFLYLHECAHHAQGHVYRFGTVEQQKADEPGQRQVFVAEAADTGVRITLSATRDQEIYFIMRPC